MRVRFLAWALKIYLEDVLHIIRPSDHWSYYSSEPQPLVASGSNSNWIGTFQEVQYGPIGVWDLTNSSLHFAALLNPTTHRRGPSSAKYVDVIPSSAVALPGHGLHGGWEGPMRGRHLFIDETDVETILDEPVNFSKISHHSFSAAGNISDNDPIVENLLGLLATDLRHGSPNGSGFGQHLISALVVHVYREKPKIYGLLRSGKGSTEPKVNYLIDRIQAEFRQKILLKDLARESGISVPYLCRIFKENTGYSPHQYIIRLRTELVKQLLTDPTLSLADVALEAGFNDQSQMTTTFRRMVGQTPRSYKEGLN